ncbi:MAG TPA: flagellar biosynthetic protein FliO [Stellaceae bacterium]|nr:flagellar biosynthetic protein FliO [Stellaceae bacterium]
MTGGLDGFTTLFLEIGGIVVALWLALWFIARRKHGFGGLAAGRDCQILRQMPLGPRERLVVVRVGARQLVLGIGSASVSLLCELNEPLPAGDADGGPFGDAIRKAVGRWRGG